MVTGELPSPSGCLHNALIVLSPFGSGQECRSDWKAGQVYRRSWISRWNGDNHVRNDRQAEPFTAGRDIAIDDEIATGIDEFGHLASFVQDCKFAENSFTRHSRPPRFFW
jgi:hypothetical protein